VRDVVLSRKEQTMTTMKRAIRPAIRVLALVGVVVLSLGTTGAATNDHAATIEAAVIATTGPAVTTEAGSGVIYGIRGGAYADADEPFLGGELLTNVARSVWFNPNLEYAFVNHGNLWDVNFDFHYDFSMQRPYTVWAGAGPAVIRSHDISGRSNGTDVGVNLLAGIGSRKGEFRPFAQAKAVLSDDDEFVVAVGVRF